MRYIYNVAMNVGSRGHFEFDDADSGWKETSANECTSVSGWMDYVYADERIVTVWFREWSVRLFIILRIQSEYSVYSVKINNFTSFVRVFVRRSMTAAEYDY